MGNLKVDWELKVSRDYIPYATTSDRFFAYGVLHPGGFGIIADFRMDVLRAEIEREAKRTGLGLINQFLVRWTFDQMLLKSAYSVDEMKKMVSQTPFKNCKINVDGVGFQVVLEK
jgi:hypothetical protein